MGAMLRILVVGLVLLAAAIMLVPRGDRNVPLPDVATVLPEPVELPETEFIDDAGRAFSSGDLRGRFSLLFFGFTNCPDICPLTLQVLATVKDELQSRGSELVPQVVFVSVDPHRDTPERIAEYLTHFDSDFRGATNTDEKLAPLLAKLGVTVHKNDSNGEYYNVVHNGTIYVLGPDGRWIALFGGSSHEAAAIVTDYLRIRRRYLSR